MSGDQGHDPNCEICRDQRLTVGRAVPAAGIPEKRYLPDDFKLLRDEAQTPLVRELSRQALALTEDNARLRELARGLCERLREWEDAPPGSACEREHEVVAEVESKPGPPDTDPLSIARQAWPECGELGKARGFERPCFSDQGEEFARSCDLHSAFARALTEYGQECYQSGKSEGWQAFGDSLHGEDVR